MTKRYGRKLLELTSVALYLDSENGDLYQIGIDKKPQWETRFNILDRDGRSYDYEKFDNLLDIEDSRAVIQVLHTLLNRVIKEMNSRK